MTKILAIETSCDETAAAVIQDGRLVLSNIVATQIGVQLVLLQHVLHPAEFGMCLVQKFARFEQGDFETRAGKQVRDFARGVLAIVPCFRFLAIGRRAAELVADGTSIVLDSGPRLPSEPRAEAHRHSAFESWSWQTDAAVRAGDVEDLFYELPAAVFRAKGILRAAGESGWIAVHCVAGRFDIHPVVPDRPPARGALVFIGTGLDRGALATLCSRLER